MADETPTLLVVDDDDAARFVKTQKLRRAGFEVREAATGTDALSLVASVRPDVVVLDVNLPDVSGLEVCRRIRDGHPGIPAIQIVQVSSTATTPQDQAKGLDHGADVYLVEPIDSQVLVATVRALLRVRRAEAALAEALEGERLARQQAEEATRLRDEFIAMLSHELRTPLNAAMGWIWQLRRSPLDETARRRAFDSLERNVQLQAQLINDLLDVSRISKGKLALELRWVDLRDIVREAVDAVREQADRKGVRITVSGEPAVVIGDEGRLLQITGNLLTNAIQFTPANGLVTVTCTHDGDEAVLCVRDTGAGIDAAFLPNVFDQFRQGGGGLTRKHGGLGLGLAVVRQLTDLHGGVIAVASEGAGLGAAFMLRLPREARPPAAAVGSGHLVLRGVRLLLALAGADDEVLRVALEAAGATAAVTSRADDHWSRIVSTEYDALLVDAGTWASDEGAPARAFEARAQRSAAVLVIDTPATPVDLVRRVSRLLTARVSVLKE